MSGDGALTLVVLAAGLARRYGGCKPLAPVGPDGEAVIDLLVSDGSAAGFDKIVLVLHPETGPSIRYHVERCWPATSVVSFAEQRLPLGTTHAVLAARPYLDPGADFAVANADDVYGEQAMGELADHLRSGREEHALMGYALRSTVITDDPVTRGVCRVDDQGHLVAISERRQVRRLDDGGQTFAAEDGEHPDKLPGEVTVSVNLWGFRSSIWAVLDAAMARSGLDEGALIEQVAGGMNLPKTEVLLPEVIGSMVASGEGLPVRVLPTSAWCLGVTHADDLPVVRARLARQVGLGIRPDRLWGP